jgi:hypothetical protein
MNNPDLYGDNSPMMCNHNNNFTGADKPSISFHQLKSKYGVQEKGNHFGGRNENQYNFEDLKDDMDQDFFHVPEENEEEPPLRLKGRQIDQSPVRIEKIDLHKYMN